MKYVLDVNILFSMLISGKNSYKGIFANDSFYAPDFALNEIAKYESSILAKTKLPPDRLKDFTLFIFSKLIIVPAFIVTNTSRKKGFELCRDIDEKDTPYVSLAIELGIKLLTRDEPLFNGLHNKGFHQVILFRDFMDMRMKEDS